MDGLRIALILAGIALVAVVYFMSVRGRRQDAQAGDFDPSGAWSDGNADPLFDDLPPQRGSVEADPLAETAINPSALKTEPSAPQEAGGMSGLETVSVSIDDSREPHLGSLEGVDTESKPPAAKKKPAKRKKRSSKTAPGKPAGEVAATMDQSGIEPLVIVINIMAREGSRFPGVDVEEALQEAGLCSGEMQLFHYRSETQPAGTLPIFTALNMVKPGTLTPADFPEMQTPGIAMVLRLPGPQEPTQAFALMHKACRSMAEYLGGILCDERRNHLTPQALNHMQEQITEYSRKLRIPAG